MAEALAKKIWGKRAKIKSSGLDPLCLSPYAVRVLQEIDLNPLPNDRMQLQEIGANFLGKLDYLILLNLGRDKLPPLQLSKSVRLLCWPLPFTLRAHTSAININLKHEQLRRYRVLRDHIQSRLMRLSEKSPP